MSFSAHYSTERKEREEAIQKIGEGVVVHRCISYNAKKQRNFIYEISSTAILTIRACDDENLVITKYPARPSRIKKYWNNAPDEIIKISITNTQNGYTF